MRTTETDSSELWLMIRPMPEADMERCPGSGSEGLPGDLIDGPHPYLLLCLECRQSVGVYPPLILPEHNREKQP